MLSAGRAAPDWFDRPRGWCWRPPKQRQPARPRWPAACCRRCVERRPGARRLQVRPRATSSPCSTARIIGARGREPGPVSPPGKPTARGLPLAGGRRAAALAVVEGRDGLLRRRGGQSPTRASGLPRGPRRRTAPVVLVGRRPKGRVALTLCRHRCGGCLGLPAAPAELRRRAARTGAAPMTVRDALAPAHRRGSCGVPALGYLPPAARACALESRHLGLVTAAEVADLKGEDCGRSRPPWRNRRWTWRACWPWPAAAPPLAGSPPGPWRRCPAARPVPWPWRRTRPSASTTGKTCGLLRESWAPGTGGLLARWTDQAGCRRASGALYLGGGYPELYTKPGPQPEPARMLAGQSRRAHPFRACPRLAECGGFLWPCTRRWTGEARRNPRPMAGRHRGRLPPAAGKLRPLRLRASWTANGRTTMLCSRGGGHPGPRVPLLGLATSCGSKAARPKSRCPAGGWACVHGGRRAVCRLSPPVFPQPTRDFARRFCPGGSRLPKGDRIAMTLTEADLPASPPWTPGPGHGSGPFRNGGMPLPSPWDSLGPAGGGGGAASARLDRGQLSYRRSASGPWPCSCADNGVVAQGVTQTGSEVTALVAGNA